MRFSAIRCFVAVVVLGTIASFLPACQTNKADDPAPADNSWVGKLLLAAAGTIALAGAARLLMA